MGAKLITMLTYNDATVSNALEVFDECADLPAEFWGFKDIGLSIENVKRLVDRMKAHRKTIFLEVVSLTERECLAGARLALECGFDYLLGTVFYPAVLELLKGRPIKYLPFCGRVGGHPSVLHGSVEQIIQDAKRIERFGVDGFDLLAYRHPQDPEGLAREFVAQINLPVVIAGSIDSFTRLDVIRELNPWALTIGSAFFSKRFVPDGSFRDQIERVLLFLDC